MFEVRFQGKGEIKVILPIRLKWKIQDMHQEKKEEKKTVVSMYPEEQQQYNKIK